MRSYGAQCGGEVPHYFCLVKNFITRHRGGALFDRGKSIRDDVEVGLRVDAPRDSQAGKFHGRAPSLSGLRICIEHEGADIYGSNSRLKVELEG